MILFKYLTKQLSVAIISSMILLLTVIWLTRSLSFLSMITIQGIGIGTFLKFTLIMLPDFILIIAPITLFGSILFIFNKLTNDRELFVMKAMGLSHFQLAKPTLAIGFVLTLLGYTLSLHFAPMAYDTFRDLQYSTKYDLTNIVLQEGEFTTISSNVMIYFKSKQEDGAFHGVMIYDEADKDKTTFLFAEKAYLIYQENGAPRILMTKGTREEIDRKTGRQSLLFFDSYSMDIFNNIVAGGNRGKKAKEYSLKELLSATTENFKQTEVNQMKVEAHKRLTQPFLTLTFGLIGIAGMLVGTFNRRSQAMRLIMLVVIIGALETAYIGVTSVAKRMPVFLCLLYVIPVLPALVSFGLLLKKGKAVK